MGQACEHSQRQARNEYSVSREQRSFLRGNKTNRTNYVGCIPHIGAACFDINMFAGAKWGQAPDESHVTGHQTGRLLATIFSKLEGWGDSRSCAQSR